MTTESEIRDKLRSGEMRGKLYKSIFRPVGSTQAVVKIEGVKFTIDDSSRLAKQAGMKSVGGRGKSILQGKTEREVIAYFNKFPKLTLRDFIKESREMNLYRKYMGVGIMSLANKVLDKMDEGFRLDPKADRESSLAGARKEYSANEKEINRLMGNIQRKLKRYGKEKIDWGSVGSLGRVKELLSEADEFLGA